MFFCMAYNALQCLGPAYFQPLAILSLQANRAVSVPWQTGHLPPASTCSHTGDHRAARRCSVLPLWSLWYGGPTSPVPSQPSFLCYCNDSLPYQPPLTDTKPCEPRGYVLFYFQGLTECPANRRCWNRSVEWMIDWHMKEKPLKRQKEWKQKSEITSGILHWCEFLFVMNPIN